MFRDTNFQNDPVGHLVVTIAVPLKAYNRKDLQCTAPNNVKHKVDKFMCLFQKHLSKPGHGNDGTVVMDCLVADIVAVHPCTRTSNITKTLSNWQIIPNRCRLTLIIFVLNKILLNANILNAETKTCYY